MVTEGWEWGKESTTKGHGGMWGVRELLCVIIYGDGYMTAYICQNTQNTTPKSVDLTVCKLCLNNFLSPWIL